MIRSIRSELPGPAGITPGGPIRNTRVRNRTLALLPESLEKRWLAYALAASAGALASSQPARADIIYTPANLYFTGGTLFIDLNHDGTNDFKFIIGFRSYNLALAVSGNGNAGAAVIGRNGSAGALPAGAAIGRGSPFGNVKSATQLMAGVSVTGTSTLSAFSGKWPNVGDKFLGLRFLINGQAHFGWAEFNVIAFDSLFGGPHVDATLLGYAYNSVPGQKINAGQTSSHQPLAPTPEPATLGLLALGSLGLAAWRRRKRGAFA